MDDRARRFRAAALRYHRGKTGRGLHYPEELHQEAVSYANARQQRGDSLRAISRDLGVKQVTLSRWLLRAKAPMLRPVEIVSMTPTPPVPTTTAGVTVTTPTGIRVEGLDLEALIALLRRLG